VSDQPRVGAAAIRHRTILWRLAVWLFAAVAPVAVTFSAAEQNSVPGHPPLIIRSLAGRDLFEFYCASCHGRDATGHGPVAAALKRPPPDLTRLARDHGRIFPRERVEVFITNGGEVHAAAHGTSEMPVWGPIFRGLDPSDAVVKVRIANVVNYLESIQVKE
jgi:mono/diheme cytochrome c family protein